MPYTHPVPLRNSIRRHEGGWQRRFAPLPAIVLHLYLRGLAAALRATPSHRAAAARTGARQQASRPDTRWARRALTDRYCDAYRWPAVPDRARRSDAGRWQASTVRTGRFSTRLRPVESRLVGLPSRTLRARFGKLQCSAANHPWCQANVPRVSATGHVAHFGTLHDSKDSIATRPHAVASILRMASPFASRATPSAISTVMVFESQWPMS